ncbi:unnamed protein product, partial [Rotaria sp. Silwood1]
SESVEPQEFTLIKLPIHDDHITAKIKPYVTSSTNTVYLPAAQL